jgi:hypothetical protein
MAEWRCRWPVSICAFTKGCDVRLTYRPFSCAATARAPRAMNMLLGRVEARKRRATKAAASAAMGSWAALEPSHLNNREVDDETQQIR